MKNLLFLLLISGCTKIPYDLPKAVANYYAKELCSCLYVSQISESTCRNYVEQEVARVHSVSINSSQKKVTARFYLFKAVAHYVSVKSGCQIK